MSLTLGLVLGPATALVNQQGIYAVDMWACGHNMRATIHVVPILCLIVTIGAGISAYRNWRAIGSGVEEEHGPAPSSRTRFMATAGMAISAFSSLVILAQWAAVFVFAPCMRT